MTGNRLILLSPARDIATAKAAIQAGADAVYIGPPAFGARQAAGNSLQDIAELVRYARPFGVEVDVTVNTLLKDDEIPKAVKLIWQLYEVGVDAILIQDMRLLDEQLPPIRLHASTQCDNRTAEQVLALQRKGFSRVVLARELSIDQIRTIREATIHDNPNHPIELEAFVHGALCVCYSGRCFMSERLMNRSANRGECAQMCRMAYDLLDKDGNELTDNQGQPIHQRFVLSLKDMDRAKYLREMADAGITIFKIEGRLKSPDYVTNITAYYRQHLDALTGNTTHCINYTFTPNPEKTFQRSATDYFLHGRTPNMANWMTPKSIGEYVGKFIRREGKWLRIALQDGIELHAGDGIGFNNQGFQVNQVDSDRVMVNHIPNDLKAGMQLYRNYDKQFLATLQATRRVPVDIYLRTTSKGFELQIGNAQKSFDYPHEIAMNEQRTMQTQRTQLAKLGDTIYTARTIELPQQAWFIPISTLNDWRRQVLELL